MSEWCWARGGFEVAVRISWPWRFVSVGFWAALQPGEFHGFHISLGCLTLDLFHDHRHLR